MRPKWEEHHKVRIADKALEAAVNLSVRFDPDHQLPDKAIDLVDKAGARTRVPVLNMMPGGKVGPGRPKSEVRDQKSECRSGGKGAGADAGEAVGSPTTGGEVTKLTVAQVLSDKIGVPLEVVTGHLEGPALSDRRFFAALRMTGGSEGMAQSRLLELNSFLKKRLIGQDDAVERVCRRLLMAHAGLACLRQAERGRQAQRRGPHGRIMRNED